MIQFKCPECGHIGEEALLNQEGLDRITFNSTSTSDYDIIEEGKAEPGAITCPECYYELEWIEEKTCLIKIND